LLFTFIVFKEDKNMKKIYNKELLSKLVLIPTAESEKPKPKKNALKLMTFFGALALVQQEANPLFK